MSRHSSICILPHARPQAPICTISVVYNPKTGEKLTDYYFLTCHRFILRNGYEQICAIVQISLTTTLVTSWTPGYSTNLLL